MYVTSSLIFFTLLLYPASSPHHEPRHQFPLSFTTLLLTITDIFHHLAVSQRDLACDQLRGGREALRGSQLKVSYRQMEIGKQMRLQCTWTWYGHRFLKGIQPSARNTTWMNSRVGMNLCVCFFSSFYACNELVVGYSLFERRFKFHVSMVGVSLVTLPDIFWSSQGWLEG